MEQIIICIVIVIFGTAYEWLKGKTSSRKDEPALHGTERADRRPAPFTGPQNGQTAPSQSTIRYAPISHYTPIEDSGQASIDIEVISDNTESIEERHDSNQDNNLLSGHYARWRQAIIDTQILERKF